MGVKLRSYLSEDVQLRVCDDAGHFNNLVFVYVQSCHLEQTKRRQGTVSLNGRSLIMTRTTEILQDVEGWMVSTVVKTCFRKDGGVLSMADAS